MNKGQAHEKACSDSSAVSSSRRQLLLGEQGVCGSTAPKGCGNAEAEGRNVLRGCVEAEGLC